MKGSQNKECGKIRELLSSYIDGELSAAEQRKVVFHLKSCDSCREELESLQKTVNLVKNIPAIEPRRSFAVSGDVKRTHDIKLKVLGTATALIAVCLAAVFIGDISHFFDAMPLPSQPWPQPLEIDKYFWPVRETEFGLLGALVILAATSLWYWYRRSREKSNKS